MNGRGPEGAGARSLTGKTTVREAHTFASTASEQATRVWLGQPDGSYAALDQPLALGAVLDVADMSGNGRLDLLAVSATGEATVVRSRPTLDYHWQTVRPRPIKAYMEDRFA